MLSLLSLVHSFPVALKTGTDRFLAGASPAQVGEKLRTSVAIRLGVGFSMGVGIFRFALSAGRRSFA